MDSNGHLLTKTPDVNATITLDMDSDGITAGGSGPSNFPLVVIDGAELKGFSLTVNGTAGANPQVPLEYTSRVPVQWVVLLPFGEPVLVRHNSVDVDEHARIVVEGYYPDQDAYIGKWNHFGCYWYNDSLGRYALHVALFIEGPP